MRCVFTALITAMLFACNQAQPPAASRPSNALLPRIPSGSTACTPANGQIELVSRLSQGGVHLTAMSSSTLQALFDGSTVACWFSTSDASFEALFFKDAASASAFRVCETVSGQRYLYRFNVTSKAIDSAHSLSWTLYGSDVLVSSDASLGAKLRAVLGGHPPGC